MAVMAPLPTAPQESVIPFTASDGMVCNLIHVRGGRAPNRGPVLLVHGAGVRANIFRPPLRRTIVDSLLDAGYDVWLENWRASIDLAPNPWTLDRAALFDHPQAVRIVAERTGCNAIKAIVHCQGSTSMLMSAVAGLVPQIKTIVSNAVSLHPVVPRLSKLKLDLVLPLFRFISDYLNPQWGLNAPTFPAKIIRTIVNATHHECRNAVCKQVSFTYGAGFPSLWSHENLDETTHDWITHEFAACPIAFFRQIARCVRMGHVVACDRFPELPLDYTAQPPKTDARVAFIAGENNLCFLPQSQRQSFEYFDRLRPNYHSMRTIPGYGHLDIFIGKNAARDVFPIILSELQQ